MIRLIFLQIACRKSQVSSFIAFRLKPSVLFWRFRFYTFIYRRRHVLIASVQTAEAELAALESQNNHNLVVEVEPIM